MTDEQIIVRDNEVKKCVDNLEKKFTDYLQQHMELHIRQSHQSIGTWFTLVALVIMIFIELSKII